MASNPVELLNRIVMGPPLYYRSSAPSSVEVQYISMISGLLQHDPNKRFTFEQLYDHPYFKDLRNEFEQTESLPPVMSLPSTPTSDPSLTVEDVVQKNRQLFNMESIISKENPNCITYPNLKLDFNSLPCDSLAVDTCLRATKKLEQCYFVAESAFVLQQQGHHSEAFSTYLISCSPIKKVLDSLKKPNPSQREQALSQFTSELFCEIVHRFELVRSEYLKSVPESTKTPENLLNYTLNLTNEAVNPLDRQNRFLRALNILEFIKEEGMMPTDRSFFDDLVHQLQQRCTKN